MLKLSKLLKLISFVLFYCLQEVYVYNLPGGLKGLFLFHMKQILVCLLVYILYLLEIKNGGGCRKSSL